MGRTNPEAADGIDKTVYHLSRTQAELGHAVRLFSITNKPPIPIPAVEVSAYRSIVPWPLLFTRRLRNLLAWRSPLNLPRSLLSDLIAWRPDVLHLHGVHVPQHLRLARQARRRAIPYCVTVHGMLAPEAEARHPWMKRAASIVERPFLNRAAFLHALSDSEADDFRSYDVLAPVVVAPNGIEVSRMPVPGTVDDGDRLRFVFLGRLDSQQKGLDLLLEGFARSELGHAALELVGPDWREHRSALELLARRLGIAPRVGFAGPVFGQQKLDLLARATVYVHTSRWEGLAFSVLEAAGLGKPCLLTRAADPRGRFGPSGAAIVVEPTGAAIGEGLRRFASMNSRERSEMGRRGRALVEAEFTWPPTARLLIEAYRTHLRPSLPS